MKLLKANFPKCRQTNLMKYKFSNDTKIQHCNRKLWKKINHRRKLHLHNANVGRVGGTNIGCLTKIIIGECCCTTRHHSLTQSSIYGVRSLQYLWCQVITVSMVSVHYSIYVVRSLQYLWWQFITVSMVSGHCSIYGVRSLQYLWCQFIAVSMVSGHWSIYGVSSSQYLWCQVIAVSMVSGHCSIYGVS